MSDNKENTEIMYYHTDKTISFESQEQYLVDYDKIQNVDDLKTLFRILIQALGGDIDSRTIISIQPSKFDAEKYHFLKKLVDHKE